MICFMNTPLPLDFFYEVALHLSHTRDVLAITLTNRSIRSALLTSALFKSRLSLQGWDVSGWKDEDETAQLSGDWKHWMRIDYAYSRTLQLFEEAVAEDNLIQLEVDTIIGRKPSLAIESGELSLLVSSNRVGKRDQRGKRGERGRAAAGGRRTRRSPKSGDLSEIER
ncbi:hypothetical protein BGW80DRAFT_646550 [Lactifluus volemus]|nr:hypothetical protein BGW80DRAFT_646550 [Lactifluus volemus]